jgi:hypothetical protein
MENNLANIIKTRCLAAEHRRASLSFILTVRRISLPEKPDL